MLAHPVSRERVAYRPLSRDGTARSLLTCASNCIQFKDFLKIAQKGNFLYTMRVMKAQNFIFIGRSGCGKGTQATRLTDYLKQIDPAREVFYLQTGAEFRQFIQGDTYTQNLSNKAYTTGELQPEFLAVWMWSHILIEKFKGDEHLITDGSPRKFHEAGTLDSIFNFYGREKPYLIFINTSREEAIKRLLSRKRLDDSAADVIKRMDWYEIDVAPALNFYRNNSSYTFLEINGDQSPDLVWQNIQGKLALDV